MTIPYTGGCACGAIRYECTAEPLMMFHCHCRDCQRATGGPYVSAVIVAADSFRLTQGTPRFHASESLAGGYHNRGFCENCGSPVMAKGDGPLSFVGVHAASLDDPSWFRPKMYIFANDKQPWAQLDASLPEFREYMPFNK